MKQTSLASFFGAPKAGAAPAATPRVAKATPAAKATKATKATPASSSKALESSSPPPSSLRTPPSDPIDSPLNNAGRARKVKRPEPIVIDDDDEPMSPPSVPSPRKQQPVVAAKEADDGMDVDDDDEPVMQPVSLPLPLPPSNPRAAAQSARLCMPSLTRPTRNSCQFPKGPSHGRASRLNRTTSSSSMPRKTRHWVRR